MWNIGVNYTVPGLEGLCCRVFYGPRDDPEKRENYELN